MRAHKAFGSIENVSNAKFLEKLVLQGKTLGDWVVTEKIHGANFCFIVGPSCHPILACRRQAILREDEGFYGWKALREVGWRPFHLPSPF